MNNTYHLDLLTVVERLNQLSATLRTELPKGIADIPEPCMGSVWVLRGTIIECCVQARSGAQVKGQIALQHLRSVQGWQVTLEQEREKPFIERAAALQSLLPVQTQRVAMQRPENLIFRQCTSFDPKRIEHLPAKERMVVRMVLLMVNGSRSVGQIQAQLSLPAETIDRALQELQRMQIIEEVERDAQDEMAQIAPF